VKGTAYFFLAGPGTSGEKSFSGEDLTGIAETTVFHPCFGEALYDILKLIGLRKSFNGDYFASLYFESRDKAGLYHIAVEYHRTNAAVPDIAAGFGAQKLKSPPEYVNEPALGVGADNYVFAV
jgi:hypothetical protein